MSEVRTWHEDLQLVITLNESVRPTEAEELLKKVIRECPRQELWAVNAEIMAAVQSFLPKRRRVLDELLKERLAGIPDGVPVGGRPGPGPAAANPVTVASRPPAGPDQVTPAPTPRQADHDGMVRASMRPDPVALVIKEIIRLNGTARPADADAKFRGLLGSLKLFQPPYASRACNT
jgi:hypothetical protein